MQEEVRIIQSPFLFFLEERLKEMERSEEKKIVGRRIRKREKAVLISPVGHPFPVPPAGTDQHPAPPFCPWPSAHQPTHTIHAPEHGNEGVWSAGEASDQGALLAFPVPLGSQNKC